jgi:hypothetical protein
MNIGKRMNQLLAHNDVDHSKSDARAQKAQAWVEKEVEKLCVQLRRIGRSQPNGAMQTTFGELFRSYADISDTLVGIMIRCRKRNLVHFEGDMLFSPSHDHVIITLLNGTRPPASSPQQQQGPPGGNVDLDTYRKMLKAGLPEGAVRHKMGLDGVDENLIFGGGMGGGMGMGSNMGGGNPAFAASPSAGFGGGVNGGGHPAFAGSPRTDFGGGMPAFAASASNGFGGQASTPVFAALSKQASSKAAVRTQRTTRAHGGGGGGGAVGVGGVEKSYRSQRPAPSGGGGHARSASLNRKQERRITPQFRVPKLQRASRRPKTQRQQQQQQPRQQPARQQQQQQPQQQSRQPQRTQQSGYARSPMPVSRKPSRNGNAVVVEPAPSRAGIPTQIRNMVRVRRAEKQQQPPPLLAKPSWANNYVQQKEMMARKESMGASFMRPTGSPPVSPAQYRRTVVNPRRAVYSIANMFGGASRPARKPYRAPPPPARTFPAGLSAPNAGGGVGVAKSAPSRTAVPPAHSLHGNVMKTKTSAMGSFQSFDDDDGVPELPPRRPTRTGRSVSRQSSSRRGEGRSRRTKRAGEQSSNQNNGSLAGSFFGEGDAALSQQLRAREEAARRRVAPSVHRSRKPEEMVEMIKKASDMGPLERMMQRQPSREPSAMPQRSVRTERRPSKERRRSKQRPQRSTREPSRRPSRMDESQARREPSRRPSRMDEPQSSREPSRRPSRMEEQQSSREPTRRPSRMDEPQARREPSRRPSRMESMVNSPTLGPGFAPPSAPSTSPSRQYVMQQQQQQQQASMHKPTGSFGMLSSIMSGSGLIRKASKTKKAKTVVAQSTGGGGGGDDAVYAKYYTMLKIGLPAGAVAQAMARDEVDESGFDWSRGP